MAEWDDLPHTSQRSAASVTFEDALNIHTDGASLSNPRRGGIGIHYIVINAAGDEEWIDECPLGYKQATNNEMELMACMALREIPPHLLTDNVQRAGSVSSGRSSSRPSQRVTRLGPNRSSQTKIDRDEH